MLPRRRADGYEGGEREHSTLYSFFGDILSCYHVNNSSIKSKTPRVQYAMLLASATVLNYP